jgi:aromatase
MSGYTENSIVILRNIVEVFDLTNQIEKWPSLFTEYKSTEIIERKDDYIKFKLTMKPDDKGNEKSWVSERTIDRENFVATANRLDPLFPFTKMKILWKYEELPKQVGVIMTWIQEFDVDPGFKFDVYNMESFLNRSTRIQMKAVRDAVEKQLKENK